MTSDASAQPRPISPLRARMIEDMTVRRFKDDTRRDYIRQVRAFAAFIGRSPDTATAEELRRFQLHQTQSGMHPPSINSAVSALRFFFTVTLDRPDLASRLTVVPYPRRIPTVLSVDEMTLAAGGIGAEVQGRIRHRLRRRAARLGSCRTQGRRHRFQAHAAARRARQGRQGPPRDAVAAAARTAARLVAPGRRRNLLLPGGWLFPGRNPVEPLSARQLCRVVCAAAQAAGINKRVSPHTLRHSFATHLLEQGVDIRVIQTLLGHAKLDTTALYTRVANTTIRAVTSPLDRLAPLMEQRPRPEA